MPELPAEPSRRLYPPPSKKVCRDGIYGDLELPLSGPQSRPYVLINMVASVDGRSSVSGKASCIGGEEDRRVMRRIRSRVDAVMVGAGTLRAERLNLGLDDPDIRQPLAVILCGSGPLPLAERLVQNSQDTLLAIPDDIPYNLPSLRRLRQETPARTEMLRVRASGPGRVDLRELLAVLRSEYGIRHLLVEGGPALNRALIDAHLVDELFLTVAPKVLAGEESTIMQGGEEREPQDLTLLSVHVSESSGELFLRYRLKNQKSLS